MHDKGEKIIMYNEQELKQILFDMSSKDWKIPSDINPYLLSLNAFSFIGTTNSILRDDLILVFLWKMITEKVLSKDQIKHILTLALSENHLFYKLGEEKDDSVFNRAFTILIVRWIIFYHNNYGEDLFTKDEMNDVFNKVIEYVKKEKDFRGYVINKGWAHSMGHAGDCLRSLALCHYMTREQLKEILEVVKTKISISYYAYKNEETERLVSPVINVIERNIINECEIIEWFECFTKIKQPEDFNERHFFQENLKGFLRSLYFRLKYRNCSVNLINELENNLHIINHFFNNIDIR